MKKVLAIIFVLALTLAMFAGCNTKTTEDPSKETIVIGIDDSFPPLGFRNTDNEIVGFDIDLAKAVGEKMGVNVKFEVINWDFKEELVNQGKIDVIWNGYTITENRKEKVEFTKPYIANAQVIVVKADSAIGTIADVAGKKVGAQTGSSAVDAIQGNAEFYASINSTIVPYEENVTALEDLAIGRIDALVVDLVVAEYYSAKRAGTYKILTESLDPEEYGIGVAKGNTELLNRIQNALDAIIADGTAKTISEKWFGEDKLLK